MDFLLPRETIQSPLTRQNRSDDGERVGSVRGLTESNVLVRTWAYFIWGGHVKMAAPRCEEEQLPDVEPAISVCTEGEDFHRVICSQPNSRHRKARDGWRERPARPTVIFATRMGSRKLLRISQVTEIRAHARSFCAFRVRPIRLSPVRKSVDVASVREAAMCASNCASVGIEVANGRRRNNKAHFGIAPEVRVLAGVKLLRWRLLTNCGLL